MAIANELSSDVAAAVLAEVGSEAGADRKDLFEMVRNFYAALRPLKAEARRRRAHTLSKSLAPSHIKSIAAGSSS